MSGAPGRRPVKPRRRRRLAAESRVALIAATTSLMARGAALTTGSIAAEAGLAQPTFYAYFSSLEEIRLAAVHAVVERMEVAAAERRTEAGTAPDFERQVQSLVRWLESARTQGDIHSIYTRFADEDSVVGETLRALGEINITRWSEELWRSAAAYGVGAQHYREVRILALIYNADIAALARAAHRNQLPDIEHAARVAVRSQWAAFHAFLVACGGRVPATVPTS
jgi:AcrR family transcriptional regulator